METDEQMFLSGNIRYFREALCGVMRNGGFVALCGESGSGKTTLLEECIEHNRRGGFDVTVIRPPICGMDDEPKKGSTLKARNILNIVMDEIAPNAKRPVDLARFTAHVQRELARQRKQDRRFALALDDGHRLNRHTLTHLKDFFEFKDGRTRLIGIILMGQLRLAERLDPADREISQITQRCEIIHLLPLGDDLEEYLKLRFDAVGLPLNKVFADDAFKAIREKLSRTANASGRKQILIDETYPLAVNNLVVAAMNDAVAVKEPLITGDIIKDL